MRTTGAALAVTAMLVLSACGGSSTDSPSSSPSVSSPSASVPSPGETPADATAWAGGICTQADELDAAIAALGQGLEVNVTGDGAGLDAVKEQLRTQAETVASATEDLVTSVTTAPADASPEVQAAIAQLDESKNALDASVDKLRGTSESAASSEGLAGVVAGISAIGVDLAATSAAAKTFAGSVTALAQTSSDSVKAAFAAAPTCADRIS
jgi:uncharacterized protein (DUF885 family)